MSSAGRNPSLSANNTMPNPTGGTRINRANTVAMVVFKPNFALPEPGPENVRERESHPRQG